MRYPKSAPDPEYPGSGKPDIYPRIYPTVEEIRELKERAKEYKFPDPYPGVHVPNFRIKPMRSKRRTGKSLWG